MSTSSSATISPTAQDPRPDMPNKPSRIVVFKLPATTLRRFLPKPTPRKNSKPKPTPKSTPKSTLSTISTPTETQTQTASAPPASSPTGEPTGDASESTTTPVPGTIDVPKKKASGARAGTKRSLGQVGDPGPKYRGKPGPKKKPRLDDGTIDHAGKPIMGGPMNGTHKLGPKANQGAINAGLRALDRSGTPCRKWERRPIQLKSFTGVVWELPSWRAPKTRLPEEETAESKEASQPSGSKANDSSTAMESEKSNTGENGVDARIESTPAASSPLPAPLVPTVAATG